MRTYGVATVTPVSIGDKVRFNPFRGIRISGFCLNADCVVTGTVIKIHNEHRWFEVEYELGDVKQRTSFNFADLNETFSIRRCRKKDVPAFLEE